MITLRAERGRRCCLRIVSSCIAPRANIQSASSFARTFFGDENESQTRVDIMVVRSVRDSADDS